MVDKTQNWSRNWKSSTNPTKQRKYRENAPKHVKDKLISANIDKELREELGTRNITIRTGDQAKIMRGDYKGEEGIINKIDRENTVVYINKIETERQDGSKSQIPLKPSNLQLTALNVDELTRIEKYEVEDIETIQVDEEEVEEALEEDEEGEMMQRMQDSSEEQEQEQDEEEPDTEDEETNSKETDEKSGEEETETNYKEIVSGTIGDAKEKLEEMEEPDYQAALKAEKNQKNRKTLTNWLEKQTEEE